VRPPHTRVAMACAALLLAPATAAAQVPDWDAIGEEAVGMLQEYLRIDTTNPPGNELAAARYLGAVLEAEGVEYEILESAPGRASLVARLAGSGERGGGLALLNHTDVVVPDDRFWSVPPFSGALVDGRIYGRGAVDMKGYGIVQLMTFLALHRQGVTLGRDVLFIATADEEAGGGWGAGYLVENRPDLLEGLEFVLTEGGVTREVEGRRVHMVETTQKMPLWLRVSAEGVAGHGSQVIRESAVNRLIRALDRLRTYQPQIKLVPPVAEALRATARLTDNPREAAALRAVERNIADPDFLERIERQYAGLLRNTMSITVLSGSSKTNVIPAEAYAELDCRLLPGESPELFIETLRDVIDDPTVEIETLLSFDGSESPRDTALWRSIEEVARRDRADAVVLPMVQPGFTDSHYFRERGVVAYGWSPIVLRPGDGPPHGVDESISVEAVRAAPKMLYDLVQMLAAPR
jgi:acetylornithine deacetylase/succinyl-diaminopimelate desuccinylase-like protein